MMDPSNLAKLVPGFEFLQDLARGAGAAVPGMGQWVAPTLDPAEIEKRIDELKTVQFWLEQNARLLGTTIQALEVQRMTLSTLQTMNVQMSDLRESMKISPSRVASPAAAPAAPSSGRPAPPTPPSPETVKADAAKKPAAGDDAPVGGTDAQPTASPPAVDPLQWWTALTKQFTEIATNAMKDSAPLAKVPEPDSKPAAAAGAKATARTAPRSKARSK